MNREKKPCPVSDDAFQLLDRLDKHLPDDSKNYIHAGAVETLYFPTWTRDRYLKALKELADVGYIEVYATRPAKW